MACGEIAGSTKYAPKLQITAMARATSLSEASCCSFWGPVELLLENVPFADMRPLRVSPSSFVFLRALSKSTRPVAVKMMPLNPSADVVAIVYRLERTALAEKVIMANSRNDRECDFFSEPESPSEIGSMSVL